jgi:hypothetical protein
VQPISRTSNLRSPMRVARAARRGYALPLALALCACGGVDSGAGAQEVKPVPGGGGCEGATPYLFQVNDIGSRCSVSMNGDVESTESVQTYCAAQGTVTLTARAVAGAAVGRSSWSDVASQKVSRDMSTATLDDSVRTCVAVCCPLADGSGCAVPNPCDVAEPDP